MAMGTVSGSSAGGAERSEKIIVATKAGAALTHTADGYNKRNLTGFIDRSLRNLRTERLDLLQLHCPPTEVYYRPEVSRRWITSPRLGKSSLRRQRRDVEEGLKAIDYPHVQSVQIISTCPSSSGRLFFAEAKRRKVGVLARVPLASACSP